MLLGRSSRTGLTGLGDARPEARGRGDGAAFCRGEKPRGDVIWPFGPEARRGGTPPGIEGRARGNCVDPFDKPAAAAVESAARAKPLEAMLLEEACGSCGDGDGCVSGGPTSGVTVDDTVVPGGDTHALSGGFVAGPSVDDTPLDGSFRIGAAAKGQPVEGPAELTGSNVASPVLAPDDAGCARTGASSTVLFESTGVGPPAPSPNAGVPSGADSQPQLLRVTGAPPLPTGAAEGQMLLLATLLDSISLLQDCSREARCLASCSLT